MAITINNIINKAHKSLSIQVSLNGLSFCIKDFQNNSILSLENIDFKDYPSSYSIDDCLNQAFLTHLDLMNEFENVDILFQNNLNSFVPLELFNTDNIGSYLQYNTKVFNSDVFLYDELETNNMVNVYVPITALEPFFKERYSNYNTKHCSTILVSKLLDFSKNNLRKEMYVQVSRNHFEIVVVQNQKLLLYNTFEYKSAEDFIYYILFTAEQLKLDPNEFNLYLLGTINKDSELYKKTYTYIRNVSIFNDSLTNLNLDLDQDIIRKNFILIHS